MVGILATGEDLGRGIYNFEIKDKGYEKSYD